MLRENKELLEIYLSNCRSLNRSEFTILNYRCDLEKFIQWYENTYHSPLYKINGDVIGLYQQYLQGKTRKEIEEIKKKQRPHSFFKRISNIFSLLTRPVPPLLSTKGSSHQLENFKDKSTKEQIFLSVNSRRRHLSSIKNFFEFLRQYHQDTSSKFQTNPVKSKIHAIKVKDVDIQNTPLLTKEHWQKIQKSTQLLSEELLVHILYWGGLRLQEVTELKVSYFDFPSFTLNFIRKGGLRHTLKIQKGEKIFGMLQSYINYYNLEKESFLFFNKKGKNYTTRSMYNIIGKIFRRANIKDPISPHSFRKACATNLYLKTKDLLFVRDYLNHSDAKVTQTYIDKKALYEHSHLESSSIDQNFLK